MYEAKFEKYLANKKEMKDAFRRSTAQKPEEFDIYTKAPSSPSKFKRRYKGYKDPN